MQFGKLLEEVYSQCGLRVLRRAATGGTTTTVVDTGMINRKADGTYAQGSNGGHILFISQTTDRAAPEGQFGEVSAYTLTTTTPTFTVPTLSAAAGAGDIYSVMKPSLQLYEMIALCNVGLQRLPALELVDTTLTGLSNTRYYNLPLAVGAYELLGIEIGSDTYGWKDASGFSITPNSSNTQDKLIFTSQPPYDSTTAANQTFKIRYRAKHPVMSIYSDYIEKSVPDVVAIATCVQSAIENLMAKRTSSYGNKNLMSFYQDVMNRANKILAENPIRMKPATFLPRISIGDM